MLHNIAIGLCCKSMLKKISWVIITVAVLELIIIRTTNVFASERYLSKTNAKMFLCFLYNVNTDDADVVDNDYYKILTGAIDDESISQYILSKKR